MDFDIEKNIDLFLPIIKNRPTIDEGKFKADINNYYLPYVQKLIDLKQSRNDGKGIIVGISAIQGAGKTTQGEVLEILLKHLGLSSVSLSIDDHYITHKELCELRSKDPRYIRRGVTHDIQLAKEELSNLQQMTSEELVLVASYDKGANHGDGERFAWIRPADNITLKVIVKEAEMMVDKVSAKTLAVHLSAARIDDMVFDLPENMGADVPIIEELMPKELVNFLKTKQASELLVTCDNEGKTLWTSEDGSSISVDVTKLPKGWRVEDKKPDFIFYDGWMLGARSVSDEAIFSSGLPALETPEAQQFAKDVNKKLADYLPLWDLIDFLNVLYVPNYQKSLEWREDAEKPLQDKGEGMSVEQIKEFVYYFWRSVHPAIHIKNLAHDTQHTKQVAIIGDDHAIVELLTPEQAAQKYP